MIHSDLFELFTQDNVNKQAKIEYSGGVMTNEELFQNSEQLTESLCSENELRFGCCEASCFKFKVANIMKPLMGERIQFSIIVDHRKDSTLVIGTYKVQSDTLTADRRQREVVAYDAMYDIINTDVAAWYNSVLPEKSSTMTLKQFREKFIRYFGLIEIVPEGGLVNDNMVVERTIEPEQISGKDVITAICEINGCFGHISRDGKFHYIYLPQAIEGLYPANDLYPDHAPEWMSQAKTGHLYPQDPKSTKIGTGTKIRCEYESFRTKSITKLQIRMEENDIGRVWPDEAIKKTDNCYIIQDNFLVYGKSHEQLGEIAQNIFGKITDIVYRPFNAYCAGNPCFEVGDPVRLTTRYDIIESYILKRTMKGIQALRDTYESSGVEKYNEKVNGVHKSIVQLKGKANILTRTIEETRLEMLDIESGLKNDISITAAGLQADITAEKNRAEGEEGKLSNNISVTASGLSAQISNEVTRATGEETKLSNSIIATANEISANLLKESSRAQGEEQSLSNSIAATASEFSVNLSSETQRAQGEEQRLGASINALAGQIVLKVDSNGKMALVQLNADPNTGAEFLVSADNVSLSAEDVITLMSGGTLNLTGKNIEIMSDNFTVDSEGNVECHNITAFSISGNAVSQFNSAVEESEAMTLAYEAIRKAQNSLDIALETIKNLNETIIPEINQTINDLQVDVAALESRVSALESK